MDIIIVNDRISAAEFSFISRKHFVASGSFPLGLLFCTRQTAGFRSCIRIARLIRRRGIKERKRANAPGERDQMKWKWVLISWILKYINYGEAWRGGGDCERGALKTFEHQTIYHSSAAR